MAKYKKLPVEIEAFRLGIDYIPNWFMDKVTDKIITLYSDREITDPFDHDHNTFCDIKTLEGVMRGNHGDYIIKGINGEIYPCKSDIFEKTYQPSDIDKKYEEMREFEELCQPVVDYLNKNYHPHATVIVTQTSAEVVEGVMAVPFKPID